MQKIWGWIRGNVFLTFLLMFIAIEVASIVYLMVSSYHVDEQAKAMAKVQFEQLHCVKSHFVAGGRNSDPVMIFKCDDGEKTYASLIQENVDRIIKKE